MSGLTLSMPVRPAVLAGSGAGTTNGAGPAGPKGNTWNTIGRQAVAGASRQALLVQGGHPLRVAAEACIREVYRDAFAARIASFPELLVTMVDLSGEPVCAAGLRMEADGFFSEDYLDYPVERILSLLAGRAVAREQVFEVTTLASRRVAASAGFVREIALLGKSAGFEWSVFTATARLRMLLHRLGLPLVVLGRADPARIGNAGDWGSYYDQQPMICAVDDQWPEEALSRVKARPCHA